MDQVRKHLSDNMRAARQRLHLSQAALAERSGLSNGYIAEIETGRKFPSSQAIEKIASSLKLKPFELFLDDNDAPVFRRQQLLAELRDELSEEITRSLERVVERYLDKG